MLTARDVLAALVDGRPVPGRHVLVTAHADDESISCAQLLSCVTDARIVQLTTGAPNKDRAVVEQRRRERAAALLAGGWPWPVLEGRVPGREAHQHTDVLGRIVAEMVADADVVWTHPYEGGHLDHDTAAWLVQRACLTAPVLHMEFASYHCTADGQCFGDFVPDWRLASARIVLPSDVLARKRAALAAYVSQASILRKFPEPEVEAYRQAPVYDFSRPSPAARCRWDVKGYTPKTAAWRALLAGQEMPCAS